MAEPFTLSELKALQARQRNRLGTLGLPLAETVTCQINALARVLLARGLTTQEELLALDVEVMYNLERSWSEGRPLMVLGGLTHDEFQRLQATLDGGGKRGAA